MGLDFNYIDGQTPLDEDEKEGLKIKAINTQGELNEFEQLNIEKAVAWLMRSRLKKEQILTEKFIQNLHKKMYGDVWKWAGNFRKSEKNIGISWVSINIGLKTLLEDTKFWIEHQTFSEEEIAIRFKHRLVSIHCFPNGNGRHSRLMADVLMEFLFEKQPFSWKGSDMVKANETRKKYILALKQADKGNIAPLLEFAK